MGGIRNTRWWYDAWRGFGLRGYDFPLWNLSASFNHGAKRSRSALEWSGVECVGFGFSDHGLEGGALLMAWDIRYASDGGGDFFAIRSLVVDYLIFFRCNLLYLVSYTFCRFFACNTSHTDLIRPCQTLSSSYHYRIYNKESSRIMQKNPFSVLLHDVM